MIPKFIHQIWIQGENLIPAKMKKNMDKIKDMHNDWQYILWDEIAILQLLSQYGDLEKYYKFIYMHQKIDYAKFVILDVYGGIYIDADAYTKKKLDSLFAMYSDYDLIISDVSNTRFEKYVLCRDADTCVNNGIIIAKSNSDVLKYLCRNFKTDCGSFEIKYQCIQNTTGPMIFNALIKNYSGTSKIKILNHKVMEPCVFDKCDIDDSTYILHKHEGSWCPKFMITYAKIQLKHKHIFYCFFIILLIAFFLSIIYRIYIH